MKSYIPVSFLVLVICLAIQGCTTISLRYPLLTEENSDAGSPGRRYYLLYDPNRQDEPAGACEIINEGINKGKAFNKAWIVKGWGIGKENVLRFKATNVSGRYIGQISFVDNGQKISILSI